MRSVRKIIDFFSPSAWFIENPHGLLCTRDIMSDIDHLRITCTYCQYGTDYRKETDIWQRRASIHSTRFYIPFIKPPLVILYLVCFIITLLLISQIEHMRLTQFCRSSRARMSGV